MKYMIELFDQKERIRLERRKRTGIALTCAAAAAGLIVCIALCRMATTANRARMEYAVVAAAVVSGWLAIGFWTLVAQDAKREAGHAEMILAGERAAVPGKVAVSRERLRIRGSITIRKVTVTDGQSERRLNVNERKAKALLAAGEDATVYAVNGYVAACETERLPAAQRTPLHARLWRKFLSQLPLYVLWLVFGAMLWGWIFSLATDTRPENKVTIFVDAYAVEDTALAVELEKELPDGIRMVRVHPVSYVMFGDEELRGADVFILRTSDAARYAELIAPDDADNILAYGVKVYDASTGQGCAQTYVQYTAPGESTEDYYLFTGVNSLHTAARDGAAEQIVARLTELP